MKERIGAEIMANIKPIKLLEYNKWKYNNHYDDPEDYGGAVFHFLERWAEKMENYIADKPREAIIPILTYIADDCSEMVDDGITGFQFHMAKEILGEFWEYGYELKIAYSISETKRRFNIRKEIESEKVREEDIESKPKIIEENEEGIK